APNHDAVNLLQVLLAAFDGLDAAVDQNFQVREVSFELIHHLVAQGRNFTVFLGAEPAQDGFAGMHDKGTAAGGFDPGNKFAQLAVRILVIDPDAMLDGDGNIDGVL